MTEPYEPPLKRSVDVILRQSPVMLPLGRPCRRVTVEKGCDICQAARCTIETHAEEPAHGFDGDSVTCDYCAAKGRMVCNGLDNGDGTEGYDIVWTDPETGEDYVW